MIFNKPKWTIFASGMFGLLQMVSFEADIEWHTSEDVGPQGGVYCEILPRLERIRVLKTSSWTSRSMLPRTLLPKGRRNVRSHIGWRAKRSIPYKVVGTSP